MSGVGRVHGPVGPQDPLGGREKTKADAKKFEEMMKVDKVGETDAEARKKRKQPAEEEEGTKPKEGPAAAAKDRAKVEFEKFQKAQKIQKVDESQAEEHKKRKRKEEQIDEISAEGAATVAAKPLTPFEIAKLTAAKEVQEQDRLEVTSVQQAELTALNQATTMRQLEQTIEEIQPVVKTVEIGKEQTKIEQKGKETPVIPVVPPMAPSGPGLFLIQPATSLPSYAYMHPEVLELFERMVGLLTVLMESGIMETTMHLNLPQFASSIFYGAQVVIREFSTAPKAFNVELVANPEAIALFESNVGDLLAAIQGGNYNFRLNRIDTRLLPLEKLLPKRGEPRKVKEKEGNLEP
jgi:hypothetical protein